MLCNYTEHRMNNIFYIPIPKITDTFIIYNSLSQTAFVGNENTVKSIRNAAIAKHQGLPINLPKEAQHLLDTLDFWHQPQNKQSDLSQLPFTPTTAVLLFTNRCNLRCTYCYADAGIHQARDLPYAIATRAIDYVCQQAQNQGLKKFRLDFHGGGEPTVMWEKLKACTEYARHQPIASTLSLTSNATWRPQVRDWIMNNIDDLSLSIDGSPATQNRNRPFADGSESNTIVASNLKALDIANKKYGVRITATPPWEHLYADVLYLCENYSCKEIQVEPAFNTERGELGMPNQYACELFTQAFLSAYDCAKSHGRRLSFSGARIGTSTTTFCQAPYNALIVTPEGDITTCFEIERPSHPLFSISHIGEINRDAIKINLPQRTLLHNLIRARQQFCNECLCKSSCAGDCYARTFKPGLNGHLNFGARCEMNRNIFIQIMLRLIAQGHGIWQLRSSNRREEAVG